MRTFAYAYLYPAYVSYHALGLLAPDVAFSSGLFEDFFLPVDPVIENKKDESHCEYCHCLDPRHLAGVSHHKVGRERVQGLLVPMEEGRKRREGNEKKMKNEMEI